MIVRDSRSPRGRDVGRASLFSILSLNYIPGPGAHTGEDYRAIGARIAAQRRPPRPKPEPAVMRVECRCGVIFETRNVRRAYCSHSCRDKAARRSRVRQVREIAYLPGRCHCGTAFERRSNRQAYCSRACKLAAAGQATCHPDRKVTAKGLCRPCYNADWRRKVA